MIVLFISLLVLISACGEANQVKENQTIKLKDDVSIDLTENEQITKEEVKFKIDTPKYDAFSLFRRRLEKNESNEFVAPENEPRTMRLKNIWSSRGRDLFGNPNSKYLLTIYKSIYHLGVSGFTETGFLNFKLIDSDNGKILWKKKIDVLDLDLKTERRYEIDTNLNTDYFLDYNIFINLNVGEIVSLEKDKINIFNISRKSDEEIITIPTQSENSNESSFLLKGVSDNYIYICGTGYKGKSYIIEKQFGKIVKETEGKIFYAKDQKKYYEAIEEMENNLVLYCYDDNNQSLLWKREFLLTNKEYLRYEVWNWSNITFFEYVSFLGRNDNDYRMIVVRLDPQNGSMIWEKDLEPNYSNYELPIVEQDMNQDLFKLAYNVNSYRPLLLLKNGEFPKHRENYNNKDIYEYNPRLSKLRTLLDNNYANKTKMVVSDKRIYLLGGNKFAIIDIDSAKEVFTHTFTSNFEEKESLYCPDRIMFYKNKIITQNSLGTYCFSDEYTTNQPETTPMHLSIDAWIPKNMHRLNDPELQKKDDIESENKKKLFTTTPLTVKIKNNTEKDMLCTLETDGYLVRLENNKIEIKKGDLAEIKVWVKDYQELNKFDELRIIWDEGIAVVSINSPAFVRPD